MKKILFIFIVSIAFGLSSCRESFIDVPTDPGVPTLDDILFAQAAPGNSWVIATRDIESAEERPLLYLPDNVLYLSKPVNGQYLYYNYQLSYPGTNVKRLMRVNVDSTQQIFVKNITDLEIAVLSNDAMKIAYTVHSQNRHELRLVNADGTGDMLLSKGLDDGFSPAFSPDGKRIAFITEENKGGPGHHDDSLFVINIDGTARTMLYVDREGLDKSTLCWSPVGQKILVIGDDKFEKQLLLINTDGSGKQVLTNDKSYKSQASFSPDGRTITFLVGDYGTSSVAMIPVAGGAYEKVYTDENCYIKYPSFSNDNSKILFISEDNRIVPPDSTGTHDLKLIDISTKTTQILSQNTYTAHWKR